MPKIKKRYSPAPVPELRTVAFIRSDHSYPDGVETLALLQVRTHVTSRDELAVRLREAVHQWTLCTELGARVRKESSEDTNIGDLASYDVLDVRRCWTDCWMSRA